LRLGVLCSCRSLFLIQGRGTILVVSVVEPYRAPTSSTQANFDFRLPLLPRPHVRRIPRPRQPS
jgi:hypothetical protein